MKKNPFHIKIIFILLIAIFLSACEDVVQVDIDSADLDLVTVEAYVTTSNTNNVWVKLERSLPVDNTDKNPPIENAIIEISDDSTPQNSITLKQSSTAGWYGIPENVNFTTSPGRTYTIKITMEDGTIITGEEYLQKVEPLDTVKVNLSPRGDYEFLAVYISTQETLGPGHYYKWDIYVNNRLLYGSDNLSFASDELVDGNYVNDLEIFTDWFDSDDESEDKILLMGDTIKVLQSSISRDVYNFYLGMQNQAFAGGPFSVPPANVPGNLSASNGKKVLGLFSVRDVAVGNLVVIDSTNYTPLARSTNF